MNENIYIYGSRAVIEAIDAGKEIEKVMIQTGLDNELHRHLRFLAKKNNIPLKDNPKEYFNRFRDKNHQGVIAVLTTVSFYTLESIIAELNSKNALILALDGITDVRNLGAICRTAEIAGVDCIIVPQNNSAPFNEEAIKASAGAIHHLKICRVNNIKTAIQQLLDLGITAIACSEKANQTIYQSDLKVPMVLVMGNESKGISPALYKMCSEKVSLPQYGKIGSLNVSVATGIILYEALRQRNL